MVFIIFHSTMFVMSSFFPALVVWFLLALSGQTVSKSYRSYPQRVEKHEDDLRIESITEPIGRSSYSLVAHTSAFNARGLRYQDSSSHENQFRLEWGDKATFEIAKITEDCERYEWRTSLNLSLSVTLRLMDDAQLYGGPEMSYQSWPVQNSPLDNVPYVTHDGPISQSVLERYWLTSAGQYVYVDEIVPLFVSQTNTSLTVTASIADPYIRKRNVTVLKFRFCDLGNVKIAHQNAIANVFEKPSRVPDFRMIQYPIWSTWAVYKANISEKSVLQFAETISSYGFPNSALEIDDKWETCYGSLTVDKEKFPDMKRLVGELKSKGYRVTLWVHPFINVDCSTTFSFARDAGYLVKSTTGSLYTVWWNGVAGAIDFTNPEAAEWWSERLRSLRNETGLDSFKFDAGEMSYLPQVPLYKKWAEDHPDTYIKAYVETVRQFGDMIEIRTARGVQGVSPFVRMIDRDTRWTGYRALDTLIPALLQMNIVGYPFVLPDMIGGNAYGSESLTEEMYLRWLQISVFMPALQFSLPPWNFSNKTIEITKKFIKLHALYATKIHQLMIKSTKDGTPVNLPLWWIAPKDNITYSIGSEFLLGEDILVAPVIEKGAVSRDIYLPEGKWRDENQPRSTPIQGPIFLMNYEADLHVLPYFSRLDCDTCAAFSIRDPKLFTYSIIIIASLLSRLF